MAISENWAYLLEPGLREVFYVQRDALAAESKIPLLFNQITSAKATEAFVGAGGMNDWPEYKGAIEYDDLEQLFKTTLTHAEYVKGFKVERKLVDDDQYNMTANETRLWLALGDPEGEAPFVVSGKIAMATEPMINNKAMINARPRRGAVCSAIDKRGACGENDANKSLIPKSGCESTQSSG